ncbi:dihydrofolate reductase [Caldimonas tepidiphila]|uniref:dihydrofolate reductase n=1 Tax=Caldimonas tepidiphila TaxID=2315841 RepID=UPI000E5BFF0D|nr:dihydrofolate reductase [Caldimonas tepidiphila]
MNPDAPNTSPAARPVVALIAAVARNGVIGRDNALLWHLPEDMKHFRRVTLGCPVIMGRRTWDSLPDAFRPLPRRRNIVVTRNPQWQAPGAEAAHSIEAALALVAQEPRVFVIGGAQLYAEALPRADELVLTELDRDFDGDAAFPAWPREAFDEVSREVREAEAPHGFGYAFVTYRRRTVPEAP